MSDDAVVKSLMWIILTLLYITLVSFFGFWSVTLILVGALVTVSYRQTFSKIFDRSL
jgi:hypothetical protein